MGYLNETILLSWIGLTFFYLQKSCFHLYNVVCRLTAEHKLTADFRTRNLSKGWVQSQIFDLWHSKHAHSFHWLSWSISKSLISAIPINWNLKRQNPNINDLLKIQIVVHRSVLSTGLTAKNKFNRKITNCLRKSHAIQSW